MTCESLTEAIFRLGQVSTDTSITNHSLLKRIARIAADAAGSDATLLAVFEHGLSGQAKTCRVIGPWAQDETPRFHSVLCDDEHGGSVLADRLKDREHNRMYNRADLISDDAFIETQEYNHVHKPLGIADQAIGVYPRPDGTDLLISFLMQKDSGPITRQIMARGRSIAPYVAHCWAKAWKREPAWVGKLKPQTKTVLELVLEGYDDDQIAQKTGLTYHSVRAHLKRLFREADVRSRLHLMQVFRQIGPAKPWESEAWTSEGEDLVLLTDPSESAFGFSFSPTTPTKPSES